MVDSAIIKQGPVASGTTGAPSQIHGGMYGGMEEEESPEHMLPPLERPVKTGLERDVLELNRRVTNPVQRRSQALAMAANVMGRLVAAGHLPAGTKWDTRLPAAVQEKLTAAGLDKSVTTYGALTLALVGDVDGDRRLDFDLTRLAKTGVLSAEHSLAKVGKSLANAGPRARTAVRNLLASPGAPRLDAPARATAEGLRVNSQRTLHLANARAAKLPPTEQPAREGVQMSSIDAKIALVRLRNGRLVAFDQLGKLPAGATVYTSARLQVDRTQGQESVQLHLYAGSEKVTTIPLEATGRPFYEGKKPVVFDRLEPRIRITGRHVRSILGQMRSSQRASALPKGDPVRAIFDYWDGREKFPKSAKPKDPNLAVAWRARRGVGRKQTDLVKLRSRFGLRPLPISGYIAEPNGAKIVGMIRKAALPKHGIKPAFLYTVVIGEGLDRLIAGTRGPAGVNGVKTVSGYNTLGVDHFASEFQQLKRYLPKYIKPNVHFVPRTATNESHEKVRSAAFLTGPGPDGKPVHALQTGLHAVAARLAMARAQLIADVRRHRPGELAGLLRSEEMLNFWTYLYYNTGAGNGRKYLLGQGKRPKNLSLHRIEPWPPGKPTPKNGRDGQHNSLRRIAAWNVARKLF